MSVFGTTWIRAGAVIAATALFAFLFALFMAHTWNAETAAPEFDPDDIKIATGLAGALGALFAVALGVEAMRERDSTDADEQGRRDSSQRRVPALGSVGRTLTATDHRVVAFAATVAVWTYFLVGVAAAVTWEFNKEVTPSVVKTLAQVMAGYVVALVGAVAAAKA